MTELRVRALEPEIVDSTDMRVLMAGLRASLQKMAHIAIDFVEQCGPSLERLDYSMKQDRLERSVMQRCEGNRRRQQRRHG